MRCVGVCSLPFEVTPLNTSSSLALCLPPEKVVTCVTLSITVEPFSNRIRPPVLTSSSTSTSTRSPTFESLVSTPVDNFPDNSCSTWQLIRLVGTCSGRRGLRANQCSSRAELRARRCYTTQYENTERNGHVESRRQFPTPQLTVWDEQHATGFESPAKSAHPRLTRNRTSPHSLSHDCLQRRLLDPSKRCCLTTRAPGGTSRIGDCMMMTALENRSTFASIFDSTLRLQSHGILTGGSGAQ